MTEIKNVHQDTYNYLKSNVKTNRHDLPNHLYSHNLYVAVSLNHHVKHSEDLNGICNLFQLSAS